MNFQFAIYPYKKAGNLLLGQNKSEVHSLLNKKFDTLATETKFKAVEYYHEASIQIEYDENNRVIFIGLSNPIDPIYNDIHLLSLTKRRILQYFGGNDKRIYQEPNSLIFLDQGLCFYFNDLSDNSIPEQIAIFTKGYYDAILNLYNKVDF